MSDTTAEVEKTTSLDASQIICSICIDAVAGDVHRSTAKLQCGHEFHLDCIGSAFNAKGLMQCPNCREIETGCWLYASGPPRAVPEIVMEDRILLEEQHGPSYPEIPFNIHWCPFSGLARAHSTFEALESSPPAYHSLHRPQNMFAEHGGAATHVPHSYIAYFRPMSSASSATNGTVEDPNFSYHLNGASNSHIFPVTNVQYPNGVYNSHLIPANSSVPNNNDQAQVAPVVHRSTGGDFRAMTRSVSNMQPFLVGHGRPHERSQSSQTMQHPHYQTSPLGMPATIIPSMARFHGQSTLPPPPIHSNSVSNNNGGFFMFPSQGSSVQGSHQTESSFPNAGSDSSNMAGNFWNGHWS